MEQIEEFERIVQCSQEIANSENREISFQSAFKDFNFHKNRYKDVLPLENTRVKLNQISGQLGSDYINANYIHDSDEKYIACQAPLPHTIVDFWRMIWEQNTGIIVMLTKLIEKNCYKAHLYWPQTPGARLIFGPFSITLYDLNENRGTVFRRFQVENLLEPFSPCRLVTQLHYVDWPDHGCPRTTDGIRYLIKVKNQMQKCEKNS